MRIRRFPVQENRFFVTGKQPGPREVECAGMLSTTPNDRPFISASVRAANKAEVPGSSSHDLGVYHREFNLFQFVSACFSHEDKRQSFKATVPSLLGNVRMLVGHSFVTNF